MITRTESRKNEDAADLLINRNKLIVSILELDNDFDNKSIAESDYKIKRQLIKRNIIEIDKK